MSYIVFQWKLSLRKHFLTFSKTWSDWRCFVLSFSSTWFHLSLFHQQEIFYFTNDVFCLPKMMFARNVLASVDYVEKLKFRVHWRSIFKERASCIDHRASEVHRASTIEHPKLTVHRASTIDVQKNEHQASTIEHPKFTVHRASTLKWNHVRTSGPLDSPCFGVRNQIHEWIMRMGERL